MSGAASISVVIPAMKVTPALTNLIQELGREDICEIIIVGPNKRIGFSGNKIRNLSAPLGRGPQIQAGLNAVRGDIIWIVHDDTKVPPNCAHAIRKIMAMPSVSMGCFPLRFDRSGFCLSLYAFLSRFETVFSTFGDQGFFFKSERVQDLPDLNDYPLLEDVIIRRALLQYGKIKKSSLKVLTCANRFDCQGPMRTQFKNLAILWKFWRGVSPQTLYQEYYDSLLPTCIEELSLEPPLSIGSKG